MPPSSFESAYGSRATNSLWGPRRFPEWQNSEGLEKHRAVLGGNLNADKIQPMLAKGLQTQAIELLRNQLLGHNMHLFLFSELNAISVRALARKEC